MPANPVPPIPFQRIQICEAGDVLAARQQTRETALLLGFSASDASTISAAVSEIARNIVHHAKHGEMLLQELREGERRGILIIGRDRGPGIANITEATDFGSERKGIGVGLAGAKWLMDEFDIVSTPGRGTTVCMKKWLC